MIKLKKKLPSSLLLWTMIALFCWSLVRLDDAAFKQNDHFNIRYIQSNLPANPQWETAPPSEADLSAIDEILDQPFYYMAKGSHAFAFLSQDGRYVIKFHKYPSHMRILPWVNRPFAYQFSKRRLKIKEYNFKKLDYHMSSYKNSFENLKEETGLIYVHTNPTSDLHLYATLVDKTGNHYDIPLDHVTFILQQRANLLYTTLDALKEQDAIDTSKQIISSMIQLFVNCCQKGYVDEDPILRKNYGIIDNKAIHIDIGDMAYREEIKEREHYIPHVKEMTASLRKRIVKDYPYLLEHYEQEINNL